MTRKVRWISLAIIALPVCGLALLARHIDQFGQRDDAATPLHVDAIIVLGAHVLPNGKASNSLRERTAHAANLQKRGVGDFLLCTGGVGENPPAEGEVAAQLAVKLGVPEDKIAIENQSTSTRENLLFAAIICHERGWKRVLIVSQGFHLFRAKRDAQRAGLTTFTSPVPDAIIDARPLVRWRWTLRESVLLTRDVIFGMLGI